MAKKDKKKAKQKDNPGADAVGAVRTAVERTFQATADSAQSTRTRAQDLVDEVAGAAGRLREMIEQVGVLEDLKGLRGEVESLARRVAALETSPAKPAAGSGASGTRAKSTGTKSRAAKSTAAKSTGAKSTAAKSTGAQSRAASGGAKSSRAKPAASKSAASRSTAAKSTGTRAKSASGATRKPAASRSTTSSRSAKKPA